VVIFKGISKDGALKESTLHCSWEVDVAFPFPDIDYYVGGGGHVSFVSFFSFGRHLCLECSNDNEVQFFIYLHFSFVAGYGGKTGYKMWVCSIHYPFLHIQSGL
jgi:hypothetical protein